MSLSARLGRQLEIYKSDEAREAVRDVKDGDTLLVGGTSECSSLCSFNLPDATAVKMTYINIFNNLGYTSFV